MIDSVHIYIFLATSKLSLFTWGFPQLPLAKKQSDANNWVSTLIYVNKSSDSFYTFTKDPRIYGNFIFVDRCTYLGSG